MYISEDGIISGTSGKIFNSASAEDFISFYLPVTHTGDNHLRYRRCPYKIK
jgi:hypothetical protein